MKVGSVAVAVLAGVLLAITAAPAGALEPPQVVVGSPPQDDPPGPELPTKQDKDASPRACCPRAI